MVDFVTKEKRSEIMRAVGTKNTRPEIRLRSIIHSLGYRFRLHRKELPGTPDLVFPKYKKVVFVHGCFWHGHEGCPKARLPKSNTEYWKNKIENNRARDQRTIDELEALGWKSSVVWQCEIKKKNEDKLKENIQGFLSKE